MQDSKKLIVWRKAHELTLGVYNATKVAQGSASELEYELLLARDLRLLPQQAHDRLAGQVAEIKKMTTALIRKLKTEN